VGGKGGEGRGRNTQALYAHMNKKKEYHWNVDGDCIELVDVVL
jgi:hypothetical protein